MTHSPSARRAVLVALFCSVLPAWAVDSTTVFNEVMYHPAGVGESEWIELHNEMAIDMDLAGWRITGGVNYTFGNNVTIPAGGYLVVAASPPALQASSGITGVLGPWTGSLSNGNETITLKNRIGRVMDEFSYKDNGNFPVAADGGGVSLAKRSRGLASGQASSWTYSGQVGGTPAGDNFPSGLTLGPAVTLAQYSDAWNFNQSGVSLGVNWAQTIYAAGSGNWLAGPGVFAFDSDTAALPVGTVLADPGTSVVTEYFQRTFNFNGDPAQTVLQLNMLLDDGAVVYLNGVEATRIRMPAGTVTSATSANTFVDNAAVGSVSLPTTNLINGTNVLSVEVHQNVESTPVGGAPNPGGTVALSGGGLTLAQLGGAMSAGSDLALAANGAVAFAKDVYLNGSNPSHTIPHLNDGIVGNANSWLAGAANSFCGVSFGATPKTLRSIAWARDQQGTYADRSAGQYTIQYTSDPNPSASTPAGSWTTLGTVTLTSVGGSFSIALRHQYNFSPISATGVRVLTVADGICVDELEVYENDAPLLGGQPYSIAPGAGFAIARVGANGTSAPVPGNFARANAGAVSFGSSELNAQASPGVFIHHIADVIDGVYGNSNSWISAGGTNQYIGVRFAGSVPVARVAWGRDSLGQYADRCLGGYTLQYTTVASPGTGTVETETASSGWKTIGTVTITGSDSSFSAPLRHEFSLTAGGAPIMATGLRIKVSDSSICMDELEVSGVPQSDVVFGAQLSARSVLPAPGASPLVINEVGGSADGTWRLELRNNGTAPLELGGFVVAASNAPGGYTLPAQTLPAGGLLVLDQSQLGFRPPQDGRVFLYTAGRATLLDAAAVKTTVRARRGTAFLRPMAATFGGDNTFSLTSDVVINEIMYHAPPLPGTPPISNPEEWVELYNKGAVAVDLGGWKFDEGISFTFPAGTMLAAGEYLVVANNASALTAKWPEQAARIRGNFSGSLSNDGERILLVDALGNPASEATYGTGGAWPELADGGGSSLELRDARADLSNGAAWGASDPLAGSDWQTVSYTMISGQAFGQTPILWNEFRLGMLDAGECLIDDVSVVRVSNGQQLIQGGDFESLANKWRFLGSHGTGAIEPEPGNGGNHVLHMRATSAFSFNQNHVESTFVGNTALLDGQSYTVTFRAKWLRGSNLLNSRGYYSRLARTTALTIPTRLGTPGRVNTKAVANLGPTLGGLAHSPVIPAALEAVTVTVKAQDPDGMGAVNLRYAVNGSASFATVAMTVSNGTYTGTIPGQSAATIVQFYVEAADALNATSALPAAGAASRALYVVNDGVGTALTAHEFRIIMLPAETTSLLATLNRVSDARIGGTVIYQRSEVFYDIGVRLQGTAAGRVRDGDDYTGYDVGFRRDHLFRGVHDSVNIDRSGRAPAIRGQDEIYIKHMFHRAGLPCTYDDLVYLVAPSAIHTGTAILQMAGYEGTFVDSQYGGKDGTIFNLDGTYEPSSTSVPTDVESVKNPVPLAGQNNSDFTDFGTDKEIYRGQLEPRAGRTYDDFSGLIGFSQTMALPTAQLVAQIGTRMDVDQWMRCAALYSLCGLEDCYMTAGFQHNFRVWVPKDGTGIQALPWDMDFIFYRASNSAAILCGGNLRRIIDNSPAARRAYYGHLQDMCNTVFDAGYMTPWLTHYGTVVGQSMAGRASYISARKATIMSLLPVIPAFAITTNGGANFMVTTPTTLLTGTGGINVREFRRTDTGQVLDATWTGDTTWQLTVALNNGDNPITIQAYDFQGTPAGNASITINSSTTLPRPRDFLRVTEVMYHPAPPVGDEANASVDEEDFEFIELRNVGTQPLDISGCKFVEGIDFTFGASTSLAAGENILVVRNVAAFRARYGPSPRVAGAYGPADALNNDGETLTLNEASGALIQSFAYGDGDGWPGEADGDGYSLVAISPQTALDRNLAQNWRASTTVGGNPNSSDAAVFSGTATADADGDGLNAFLEFAMGTSDTVPNAAMTHLVPDGANYLFTFQRAANADDLVYSLEAAGTLPNWGPANATRVSATTLAGVVTETWRVVPTPGAFFVRVKVGTR
jgi:hypothetical protein